MSHHCKLMLNTVVVLGIDAVTLASDPCYLLAAQIDQAQLFHGGAYFFFCIEHAGKKTLMHKPLLLPAS